MIHDFTTVNTDVYTSIDNPGRCSGMSADWARKTLTFGNVRYAGMLSVAAANIAASAYMLMPAQGDTERVIESNRLNVGTHTAHGGPGPIAVNDVVEGLLGRTGVFVWSLDFMAGGGHFMGWRNDIGSAIGPWPKGARVQFFDPNSGQYSFTSLGDVRGNLPGLLTPYGALSEFETWAVTSY